MRQIWGKRLDDAFIPFNQPRDERITYLLGAMRQQREQICLALRSVGFQQDVKGCQRCLNLAAGDAVLQYGPRQLKITPCQQHSFQQVYRAFA